MKINHYWPKCNLINGEWVDECIDSYWLECSYEEAEKYVFPYLIPEQIETSKRIWEQGKRKDFKKSDRFCFLVSKDSQLSYIYIVGIANFKRIVNILNVW
ncbi:hypothetical protein [Clostridium sp.]|uniref:hypothetical protein n=1 Tax=Clostridium sp. TaxID=1506 RepID=UPI002619CF81|nr:hypothetical protein [uncultured Clostridium sp.]